MVTLYLALYFANDAYNTQTDDLASLPGWRLLETSGGKSINDSFHGYFGKAYENTETGEIVIAHRGTVLQETKTSNSFTTPVGNLGSDTLIFLRQLPPETRLALEFSKKITEAYPGRKKTHAGHSLGGYHAHICGHLLQDTVIAFDPPGCLSVLKKWQFNQQQCNNHYTFTRVRNLVNGVDQHVGKVYTLDPNYKLPAGRLITQSIITLRTHMLENFFAVISPDTLSPAESIPDFFHLLSTTEELLTGERTTMKMFSKVDPSKELLKDVWVLSFLSSKSLIGHARLVIEGINDDGNLYFLMADIQAEADNAQASSSSFAYLKNIKGKITEVRVYEKNEYDDMDLEIIRDSFNNNWYAKKEDVQKVIDSIKEDSTLCDRITRELIEIERTPDISDTEKARLQTAKRQEYLPYQLAGKHTSFKNNKGDNCTTWVEAKLNLAKVGNGAKLTDSGKAVPLFHACVTM